MFKFLKPKRYAALIVVFAMIIQLISPVSLRTAFAATGEKTIQILATSDLHGRFMAYEYASNTVSAGGQTKVATLAKELKKSNPNLIIVDNGDTIQDNSSMLFLEDEIHPMILGMNEIGYDTYTLGNHEFNYGVPALKKVLDGLTNTTALCGNVFDKTTGKPLGEPYKIVERDGVRIAIIGMVTPHITKWDGPKLEAYDVTNPAEETRKVIDGLKAENKADVFIASLHMGEDAEYGMGDSAKEVAAKCPELSVIIAGHAHSKIEGNIHNGVLITEPSKNGELASVIDLKVTNNGGKYEVTSATSKLNDMKPLAEDTDLVTKFKPYHDRALVDGAQVIGKLEGGELAPKQEFNGITQAQLEDSAVIDLILNTQVYYAEKSGKIPSGVHHVSGAGIFEGNANIVPGEIKKSDTVKVYKYDNTLKTLKINGAQLKKYMEWSAGYYNTFKTGDLTVSFNEKIRMYNYDMFGGVKYEVNISKEPGQRIEKLTYNDGTAVRDTDEIYLTVNNYRADTQLLNKDTGLYKGEGVQIVYDSTSDPVAAVRDLVGLYIQDVKGGVIKPELDNNWKITGTSIDTDKKAMAAKLVNEGKITIPTSADGRTPNVRSLTEFDLIKALGKNVNLISFNDFHGTVDSKSSSKNPGMAKFAAAIKKYLALENENNGYAVLSAGDNYQGSAMSNLTYGSVITEMLKEIKVEASALGNHEFDWGINKIEKWAKDGGFDFLASNVYDKTTGKPVEFAKPYKVITEAGKKIGLIGIATPETAFKTLAANVKNIEFRDPVAAANEWAAYLRNTEKVDAVVVLSHLGTFQDKTTKVITGEGADFAKAVKGVDAIITAHSHQSVNGTVNGIPVVQGYYNGRAIAQISLTFYEGKVYAKSSLEDLTANVKELPEDPAVKAIYDKYSKQLSPILDEVVTVLEKDLDHDKTLGVTTLGQFNAKLMMDITGVQIGLTNGGGIRAPLEKGDLTMGDMYTVFPFDNTLVTMELTGADLKKNLEHGINPDNGVGWIQYYGIKVFYDETKPVGEKISSIRLMDGTKIEADKYYTVVTNDFMATNGDGYNFTGAKNLVDTNIVMRDAMVTELKKVKSVSFERQDLLVKGEDTTVDTVAPGTIPQAGASVGTTQVMTLGFLVSILGVAMFVASRKKEENAA
ncbi:5'-nucleotidase C-terminal domain-containing protein [Clostridium sp.]|uniref:5'-nucleotidase C-terminal domain-containing protein n=1 Tax=Clostridium sp. TaxID=1506 RepID=UPI002FC94EAC